MSDSWTVGCVCLSGWLWWTILGWVPTLMMNVAIKSMTKRCLGTNTLRHIPRLHDATMRDIVKPCPDLLYSCVVMDFTTTDYLTVHFASDPSMSSVSVVVVALCFSYIKTIVN